MASGSIVEFVPARHAETVRMDTSRFKVVKPAGDDDKAERQGGSSSDSDSGSSDSGSSSSSGGSSSRSAQFYDINESSNDRGTREPRRIHKSWPVSFRSKAPKGLENQGVTCYQNAAIQALLHVPALGWYLMEVLKNKWPNIDQGSVTHDLALLYKKLMDSKRPVYPRRLIARLEDINPMLSEWNQEDSHEYYMSLIGRLQEDSVPKGKKLNSSIICDMFGGSVQQRVKCSRCKAVSTTEQEFFDLPVSFSSKEQLSSASAQDDDSGEEAKSHYTLEQSVMDFFTPEVIDKSGRGSGYQCEKCNSKTRATKRIAIEQAPEYLTVHIKRFKMENNASKKVKDQLHYPVELDLSDYLADPNAPPVRYKLLAVIVHEGRTLSSGHYIAYARQPSGAWALYDDEHTHKVPEKEAASQDQAYILLYSRLLQKSARREGESRPRARKRMAQDIDDIFSKRRK